MGVKHLCNSVPLHRNQLTEEAPEREGSASLVSFLLVACCVTSVFPFSCFYACYEEAADGEQQMEGVVGSLWIAPFPTCTLTIALWVCVREWGQCRRRSDGPLCAMSHFPLQIQALFVLFFRTLWITTLWGKSTVGRNECLGHHPPWKRVSSSLSRGRLASPLLPAGMVPNAWTSSL